MNKKKKIKKRIRLILTLISLASSIGFIAYILLFIFVIVPLLLGASSVIWSLDLGEKEEPECKCELYIAEQVIGTPVTDEDTGNTGSTGNISTSKSDLDGIELSNGRLVMVPKGKGYGTICSYEAWNRELPQFQKKNGGKGYWGAGTMQRKLYEEFCRIGKTSNYKGFDEHGLGKIGDRYMIAMSGYFYSAGDVVDVYYANGAVLKAIVGDTKNPSDPGANNYGHQQGKCMVEFMVNAKQWYSNFNNVLDQGKNGQNFLKYSEPKAVNSYVVKTVNYGNYYNLIKNGKKTASSGTTNVKPSNNATQQTELASVEAQATPPPTTVQLSSAVASSGKITVSKVYNQYTDCNMASGCESVSAVMGLQAKGVSITPKEFVDSYLPKGAFNPSGESCSPYEKFIGTPYGGQNESLKGLGCFPPVIVNAVNSCLKAKNNTSFQAVDKTGTSLTDLCKMTDQGIPIIIWGNIKNQANNSTGQYKYSAYGSYSGGTWKPGEHCMLLIGYDNNNVIVADPDMGKQMTYQKSTFEGFFNNRGKMAVALGGATTPTKPKGLTGKKGEFSGVWKDLPGDMAKTNKGNTAWKKLAPYVGHDPIPYRTLKVDKWKNLNGYGLVYYTQNIDAMGMHYNKYVYTDNGATNMCYTACGVCTTSIVISTMTGRKVAPAEVAIALNTLRTRNSKYAYPWDGGVAKMRGIYDLLLDAGFSVEYGTKLDKAKIDSCLDNNGMVIMVHSKGTKARKIGWGTSDSNHYGALRERVGDKYYGIDPGSQYANQQTQSAGRAYTWANLQSSYNPQGYVLVKAPPSNLAITGNASVDSGTNGTNDTNTPIGNGYILYKCRNCTCKGEYCNCDCHKGMAIHKTNGLKVYLQGKAGTSGSASGSSTSGGDGSNNTPDNQNQAVVITPGNIQQTPGKTQGVWGGKSTLDIIKEPAVNNGKNPTESTIKLATQYSGVAVNFDKRAEYYGKIPRYSQYGSESETWGGKLILSYNQGMGSSDLKEQGCAFYMGARICSVLQQRLINPPEMLLLYHHFGVVEPNGNFRDNASGLNALLGTMGYKVKFYSKSTIAKNPDAIQKELQASLNAGIPCGYRVKNSANAFNAKGNHWLCIDKYINGEYITTQSGRGATENKGQSWKTIMDNMSTSNNGLYIITKA